jgi:peptide/nickel transport system permease protein
MRRRHPMLAFVARRVAAGAAVLVAVSVLVFAATNLLPGDAATAILGRNATPDAVTELRGQLGLDRPVVERYGDWISAFVRGDLGESALLGQPVSEVISDPLLNTAVLAGLTLLVLAPVVVILGVVAGARAGTRADHVISGTLLGLIALPEFVVGALLISLLAVRLGMFPPVSLVAPGENPLSHGSALVLPVLTLLLVGAAYATRMLRAGVAEAMTSPYVEMARLSGVPESRVVLGALRNALVPTVQVFALTAQWLLGGVVAVEVVFAYPGLGATLVTAVTDRDLPVVQAVAMLVAAVYVAINIIADLLIVLLVPKLRARQ